MLLKEFASSKAVTVDVRSTVDGLPALLKKSGAVETANGQWSFKHESDVRALAAHLASKEIFTLVMP